MFMYRSLWGFLNANPLSFISEKFVSEGAVKEIPAFPQGINFVESDPPSTSTLMGIELFPRPLVTPRQGLWPMQGPHPLSPALFFNELSSDPRWNLEVLGRVENQKKSQKSMFQFDYSPPLPRHFWRCCSLSPGRICVSSLVTCSFRFVDLTLLGRIFFWKRLPDLPT